MLRKLVSTAGILFISLTIVLSATVGATETPSCEGFERFRTDVSEIRRAWVAEQDAKGVPAGKDSSTFTAQNWRDVGELAQTYGKQIGRVVAPAWLRDWLNAWEDIARYTHEICQAVLAGDEALLLQLKPWSDLAWQQSVTATEVATAQCPEFAQFAYDYDALDGVVRGEPVARPTPIPTALAGY